MAAPFKNKNLVGEPELTSGETTHPETKFDLGSNLIKTAGNLNITASNLTINQDSIIKTSNDFNLNSAQETTTQSSKSSTLTIETGGKAGNAYVDAAYAWKAVIDAQNKAIKSAEKLKKMEKLEDEGKASQKAVDLAAAQLVLAQTAVATATIQAAAVPAGAEGCQRCL